MKSENSCALFHTPYHFKVKRDSFVIDIYIIKSFISQLSTKMEDKWTVQKLKIELKKRGLPTKGKKEDLLNVLLADDSSSK